MSERTDNARLLQTEIDASATDLDSRSTIDHETPLCNAVLTELIDMYLHLTDENAGNVIVSIALAEEAVADQRLLDKLLGELDLDDLHILQRDIATIAQPRNIIWERIVMLLDTIVTTIEEDR